MRRLTAIALAALTATLFGCSDQSRDQYSQAGQEAGSAIKSDLKNGEKAAVAATGAAKESLKEDQAKAGVEAKQLSDATITPKIKSALASASDLHASGVDVTTVGKKITLSGSVPTAAEKSRTNEIATGIGGSEYKVIDKITVAKS